MPETLPTLEAPPSVPELWLLTDDDGDGLQCCSSATLLEACRELQRDWDALQDLDLEWLAGEIARHGEDAAAEWLMREEHLDSAERVPVPANVAAPADFPGRGPLDPYGLSILTGAPYQYGCFEGRLPDDTPEEVTRWLMGCWVDEVEGYTFFNTGEDDPRQRRLVHAFQALHDFPERTGIPLTGYTEGLFRMLPIRRWEDVQRRWREACRNGYDLRYWEFAPCAGRPALLDHDAWLQLPEGQRDWFRRWDAPEEILAVIPTYAPVAPARGAARTSDDYIFPVSLAQGELRPLYQAVRAWFLRQAPELEADLWAPGKETRVVR